MSQVVAGWLLGFASGSKKGKPSQTHLSTYLSTTRFLATTFIGYNSNQEIIAC
jgi:hypothetical protein